jgi:hypothetical protein
MQLVNNISEWIPDWLINFLLQKSVGEITPTCEEHYEHYLAKMWKEKGYDLNRLRFTFFYKNHFPQEIVLPNFFKNVVEVWCSKLEVGDLIPLHEDAYTYDYQNIERYWIALQDWKYGHIFQHKDEIITKYKCGDVFKFDNAKDIHGACNFGYEPKLSIQVSCLKDVQQ